MSSGRSAADMIGHGDHRDLVTATEEAGYDALVDAAAGRQLGLESTVAAIWNEYGVNRGGPRRSSSPPTPADFKVVDVVGLYLAHPTRHRARVDELGRAEAR